MLRADPAIDFRPALTARAFQAVFPLMLRLQYSSPDVQFATKEIGKPIKVVIRRATARSRHSSAGR